MVQECTQQEGHSKAYFLGAMECRGMPVDKYYGQRGVPMKGLEWQDNAFHEDAFGKTFEIPKILAADFHEEVHDNSAQALLRMHPIRLGHKVTTSSICPCVNHVYYLTGYMIYSRGCHAAIYFCFLSGKVKYSFESLSGF